MLNFKNNYTKFDGDKKIKKIPPKGGIKII